MGEHDYTRRSLAPFDVVTVCNRCGCVVFDTTVHDKVCRRPEHKVREGSLLKPPTILPTHLVDPDKPLTDAPTCPALSPESGTPCALPDLPLWHFMGHQSETVRSGSTCWGTGDLDHERWGWTRTSWYLTDIEQAQAEQQHLLFRAWCYLRDEERRAGTRA